MNLIKNIIKRKLKPVSCRSSWKNLWLKMKATPLSSSTLASALVFLFLKLAVMAMASFPLNSLRLKPVNHGHVRRTLLCPIRGRNHFNSTLFVSAGNVLQLDSCFCTWQRVPASIRSNDDVKLQMINRMTLWIHLHSPADLWNGKRVNRWTLYTDHQKCLISWSK